MTTYSDAEVAQNRAVWLAYLREPGRKKNVGRLVNTYDHEARCCLGHYCAAKGLQAVAVKVYDLETGSKVLYTYDPQYEKNIYALPQHLAKSLGITKYGRFVQSVVVEGRQMVGLTDVNDYTDLSPAQIADVIEQQFAAGNFAT